MKTAIVIITYNTAQLIQKQVELIRRFCKDEHDIIIVDNSTHVDVSEAIVYYNNTMQCKYYKTHSSSMNGSDSHAFACNWAYHTFANSYDYFFYLDHDNFPIKEFSIKSLLENKIMVGMGQNKQGIEYFWAGCVMWDNTKIDHTLINFSTNLELALDTGGMLYKVIERYGKEKCTFMDEIPHQNPNFNKSMYNFFVLINNGMFFHMLNGSGWNPSEANEERINSLLNILNEKTL